MFNVTYVNSVTKITGLFPLKRGLGMFLRVKLEYISC